MKDLKMKGVSTIVHFILLVIFIYLYSAGILCHIVKVNLLTLKGSSYFARQLVRNWSCNLYMAYFHHGCAGADPAN